MFSFARNDIRQTTRILFATFHFSTSRERKRKVKDIFKTFSDSSKRADGKTEKNGKSIERWENWKRKMIISAIFFYAVFPLCESQAPASSCCSLSHIHNKYRCEKAEKLFSLSSLLALNRRAVIKYFPKVSLSLSCSSEKCHIFLSLGEKKGRIKHKIAHTTCRKKYLRRNIKMKVTEGERYYEKFQTKLLLRGRNARENVKVDV